MIPIIFTHKSLRIKEEPWYKIISIFFRLNFILLLLRNYFCNAILVVKSETSIANSFLESFFLFQSCVNSLITSDCS